MKHLLTLSLLAILQLGWAQSEYCLDGTVWDAALGGCVPEVLACGFDTDLDGDGYNATDQGDGLVDAFEFDEHAWADNDNDGKADTLHSSLNEVAYTTVELSNITLPSGTSSATDTITVPAGETLDVTLQTASYGSEGGAVVTAPDGTQYTFGPFSNNQFYELGSWTAGSTDEVWTIEYTDSYGDGCNASGDKGRVVGTAMVGCWRNVGSVVGFAHCPKNRLLRLQLHICRPRRLWPRLGRWPRAFALRGCLSTPTMSALRH